MKYKVQFADIQPLTSKEAIYANKCYMGVSINNPFFWSGNIGILLKWIDKRFPSSLIIIGDHLHRINEFIFNGKSGEQAIKEALLQGDILENVINDEIKKLNTDKIKLERWQKYYDNEECSEIKVRLFEIVEKNEKFRNMLYKSCRDFIDRLHNRGINPRVSYESAVLLSSQYLIEEMAVFSYLIKKGIKVQIYPGSSITILKEIANGSFPELNMNLDKGIYIDLNIKRIK